MRFPSQKFIRKHLNMNMEICTKEHKVKCSIVANLQHKKIIYEYLYLYVWVIRYAIVY